MPQSQKDKLYNDFVQTIEPLGRRHDRGKVFNDFLTAAICSHHQTNIRSRLQERDEENEALYLETMSRYDKEEFNTFSKLLGIFMQAVNNNPYSDILGEYFMNEITRGQNGQYFTPEHICELMASMQGQAGTIRHQTIADPACGSGRLLLAFAKINPDNYFYGADNTNTCAKMSTLNFFLNGLRGQIAWMNSLSMEWYGGWQINMNGLGILPIEKEDCSLWTNPIKPKQDDKDSPVQQLLLF